MALAVGVLGAPPVSVAEPALAPQYGSFLTSRTMIRATPDRVWRALLDRGPWIRSFVGKRVLSGPAGAAGEVSVVTMDWAGQRADRREEILRAEPGRRLVIRLSSPQDEPYAFADYRVSPGPVVTVELSVYAILPLTGGPDADLKAKARKFDTTFQGKIDGDLAALKAWVEGGGK